MDRIPSISACPILGRDRKDVGSFSWALVLMILLLQGCVGGSPPPSGVEVSPRVAEILGMIESQRADDPLIGLWNATSAGFSWSVAIVRDADLSRGYTLKGLMVKPWSSFTEGEEVLLLKRSSVAGVYEGTQKWRDAIGFSFWFPARVSVQNDNLFTQYNSVRSHTFISTTWIYLREVPSGPEAARPTERSGSGFVLRGAGLVLTGYHVVEGAKQIRVILQGREHVANVTRQDPKNDLALLSVADFAPQPDEGLPLDLSLGVHPGESVFVIGFPLAEKLGGEASIVGGLVNATVGPNDDPRLFRISAPLNPGNSGGPILNQRGQVVGMALAVLRGKLVEGIGFGVKIGAATSVLGNIAQVSTRESTDTISPERIFERAAPWVVRVISR